MTKHVFKVREVGFGEVAVVAKTEEEAVRKAEEALDNGEFVPNEDSYSYELVMVRVCNHQHLSDSN